MTTATRQKRLRSGVTTGLCAAAAAKAATTMLLTGQLLAQVEAEARTGAVFTFELLHAQIGQGTATCAVRKDAGDDPDVTNGAEVLATVTKTAAPGITIDGGAGIGRVTKPGLKVEVGRAAINPVPFEMIKTAIAAACQDKGYSGGLSAVISIPGGEELAKRTMNSRLGIIGGLSVLGTTGIVEPMSESAIIETIKAEIDVQLAAGQARLFLVPGNYSRDFADADPGLKFDPEQAIKCSNYIGETLDYLCLKGVPDIVLLGHAGKLVKLAAGIMNTHSKMADGRMEVLAAYSALAGAGPNQIRQILGCVTIEAALEVIDRLGIGPAVWSSIGQRIGFHLEQRTHGQIAIEYIVFTQEHGVLTRGQVQRASG